MKFFDTWKQLGALENTLSDDHQTISYQDAILRINTYRSWLLDNNLTPPIAFCCDQSIEHLMMLMALLSTDINFALLPYNHTEFDDGIFGDQLHMSAHYHSDLTHITLSKHNKGNTKAIEGAVYFVTSGSLGSPKVVVHQRENLVANSVNVLERLPLSHENRVLIPVPIHHMYGFGAALLPSLLVGATIHITNNLNIIKFKTVEHHFVPNVIYLTPHMLEGLLYKPNNDLTYQFIVSAGDCFDNHKYTRAKAKFKQIFNLYGSTELGVIAIGEVHKADQEINDAVVPLSAVEVTIDKGKLIVEHPFGFDYYLHQPKQQSPFTTGDLVSISKHSGFRVIGRDTFSVNRDGRLLAFSELETQIKRHQEIDDVSLIKGKEDIKGHTIIAVVGSSSQTDPKILRKQLADYLPPYAMPEKVIVLPQLPKLSSGKINRKEITKLYEGSEI
ncbi:MULTISPECIES: class I adenylate-forming enzyme family protein [Pseudoalteromonas]|uniref:Class I adenylate-forming enzyme family protein n=1 Tax=Pseudoalteromonas obscura TaxID=3048491 RepID=A0ABT7EMX6_9GAMM|nr:MULTISPECIES: class I adenylate-forming enzyme family protein [Pseudoalteromonas]MBQ4838762.1 acyl--CoA ligase [Pseudoalteromonas luteoviolacea]MDK2596373.1 class I adenylate-forming enzyme family protein [Pseudoalteromonas sp. P94(2023)]